MIKVALDAMGGDNAPGEIVKGAVDAVNTSKECFVYLVGKEDVVNNELSKYTYSKEQIEVVNATEVIETGEPPVMAIRHKKDSHIQMVEITIDYGFGSTLSDEDIAIYKILTNKR